MGNLVNMSTQCKCMHGANPLPLLGTDPKALAENKPALNIMDIPKGVFGICNSPMNPAAVAAKSQGLTAPCTPAFLPPMWLPGSPTVLLRNAPALNNSCKMTCTLGGPGCISILPPGGALKVQVK